MSAHREILEGIIGFKEKSSDSLMAKTGRVAAATGIGGLAGRIAAWHPVHGGKMNRGTLIGASLGAAAQIGSEVLAEKRDPDTGEKLSGQTKDAVRAAGTGAAAAGLAISARLAVRRGVDDAHREAATEWKTRATGRMSEEDAIRRNIKTRRAMGMEGETFIPKMPGFTKAVRGASGLPSTINEAGGTVEDKLSRLAERAKGTPEGDAAARKLKALRSRSRPSMMSRAASLAGKAKAKLSGMFRRTPAARNVAGLLMKEREELNSILRFDDAPPKIDSWNPIKRLRQHDALQKWVDSRPPSAGITAEDVAREYPEDLANKSRIRTGATIGALSLGGAAAGIAAKVARSGNKPAAALLAGGAGAFYGGVGGALIGAQKKIWENAAEMNTSNNVFKREMEDETRLKPLASIRLPAPSASSYGEVAGELKKQGVGFIPRHATALMTRPAVWQGNNAFFIPRGDKGLVVASKNVHPAVARYGAGRAKDYAHYGGEQGFKKAYPKYGGIFADRDERISSTMLPEHRAWAHAGKLKPNEKDLRQAALNIYKHSMDLGFEQQLDLILFSPDPRPRNNLGMFTDTEDGGPNPEAIHIAYKQGGGTGAAVAGGAAGGAGMTAIMALAKKLRGGKVKLSAREELDAILFG